VKLTLEGDDFKEGVQHLAFSPDSKTLAILCGDAVRVWDVENRKKVGTFKMPGGTLLAAFSGDGKLLVAFDRPSTYVFDVATGKKEKHTLEIGEKDVGGYMSVSPDGKILALAGTGHAATLFDLENDKELGRFEGHKDICALAFDKTAETIAIASHNGTVVIWDVKKQKEKKTLDMSHLSGIGYMAYSADGKTVITNGAIKGNGMLVVWDVEKGQPRWTYGGKKPKQGEFGGFGYLALAPDGKTLVFTCGTALGMIGDIDSGDAPEFVPDYKIGTTIRAIAFSPDGKLLAVATDKQVTIMDAPKKKKD
jgi:WD40 repeat protein